MMVLDFRRVDKSKDADADGWFYAPDFSSPSSSWHGENQVRAFFVWVCRKAFGSDTSIQ
jgi:hypothetical protein